MLLGRTLPCEVIELKLLYLELFLNLLNLQRLEFVHFRNFRAEIGLRAKHQIVSFEPFQDHVVRLHLLCFVLFNPFLRSLDDFRLLFFGVVNDRLSDGSRHYDHGFCLGFVVFTHN